MRNLVKCLTVAGRKIYNANSEDEQMIVIKKIYVKDFLSKDKKRGGERLTCEITINGRRRKLFLECEAKWKEYLLTERADAFVVLLLPIALREKHDIASYLPITKALKENLNKYIDALVSNDKSLYRTRIIAETESEEIGGKAVGTANSLGVDSFYTIYKYGNCDDEKLKITHFYMGNISLDLWGVHAKNLFEYLDKIKYKYDRYKLVADELGKELIMTYSNFYRFVCLEHLKIHITVHTYITMAEILCFKKLWQTYLFSSTYPPEELLMKRTRHIDCAHYDSATAEALTVPDFRMVSAGAEVPRYEKTRILADFEPAQKYLRPCFNVYQLKKNKKAMKNCGKPICNKCLRLLVSADLQGNLEKFKNVVDVEKYKKHKKRYFRVIVWRKNRNAFCDELYPFCLEKYPKEIRSLERTKNFLTFHWFEKKQK